MTVYCDSEWAAWLHTIRSVIGYVVNLGGALLSWKLKKQHTISRSSAEAEYRSMVAAVSELTWVYGLLEKLNCVVPTLVTLYCDS